MIWDYLVHRKLLKRIGQKGCCRGAVSNTIHARSFSDHTYVHSQTRCSCFPSPAMASWLHGFMASSFTRRTPCTLSGSDVTGRTLLPSRDSLGPVIVGLNWAHFIRSSYLYSTIGKLKAQCIISGSNQGLSFARSWQVWEHTIYPILSFRRCHRSRATGKPLLNIHRL
jgi:hypothetical protein